MAVGVGGRANAKTATCDGRNIPPRWLKERAARPAAPRRRYGPTARAIPGGLGRAYAHRAEDDPRRAPTARPGRGEQTARSRSLRERIAKPPRRAQRQGWKIVICPITSQSGGSAETRAESRREQPSTMLSRASIGIPRRRLYGKATNASGLRNLSQSAFLDQLARFPAEAPLSPSRRAGGTARGGPFHAEASRPAARQWSAGIWNYADYHPVNTEPLSSIHDGPQYRGGSLPTRAGSRLSDASNQEIERIRMAPRPCTPQYSVLQRVAGVVDALFDIVLSMCSCCRCFWWCSFFLAQEGHRHGQRTGVVQSNAKIAQLTDLLSLEKSARSRSTTRSGQLRAALLAAARRRAVTHQGTVFYAWNGLAGAGGAAQGRAQRTQKALDIRKRR